MPGPSASITEMHRRGVVRVADDDEERAADLAIAVPEFDEAARDVSVFAPLRRRNAGGFQPLGRGGADENRVVPRQPGDRLGQLLQPAVVGESAVENRRIVSENDLEPLPRPSRSGLCRLTRLTDHAGSYRHAARLKGGVRHHAVVQPPPPRRVELRAERRPCRRLRRRRRRCRLLCAPASGHDRGGPCAGHATAECGSNAADDVAAGLLRAVAHRREQFVRGPAAVTRCVSGWIIETVPSCRASLHDSRKCASGICQWHNADVSSS
jgi:hypothetical protein